MTLTILRPQLRDERIARLIRAARMIAIQAAGDRQRIALAG